MATTEFGLMAERQLFMALDALKEGDVKPWSEMFCDDGVMEFPYAPPGFPAILDGKLAIEEYMLSYPEHIIVKSIHPGSVCHSEDGIIVEFSSNSVAVATGKNFTMKYISVIELHKDKIKRYRDYWNPLVALQAMGGVDAVLALGNQEAHT